MNIKKFRVQIDPGAPVFVIGVVSEMVEIPVWTLRKLDEMEVVIPKRVGKSTRFYSQDQISILKYIRYLLEEKKVNISGIKFIIEQEQTKGGGS